MIHTISKNKKEAIGCVVNVISTPEYTDRYACTIVVKCGKRSLLYINTWNAPNLVKNRLGVFKYGLETMEHYGCIVQVKTYTKFKNLKYGTYATHLGICEILVVGHTNLNVIGVKL